MSAKKTKYEDPIDAPFEDEPVFAYEDAGAETEDGEVKVKTPRTFQHKVAIVGVTFGFIGVLLIVAMSLFIGFAGESGFNADRFVQIVTDLINGDRAYDELLDYEFFGTLIVAGLWVTMIVRLITTIVRYAKGVRHEEKVQKCVRSVLITYFLYFGFVLLLRSLFQFNYEYGKVTDYLELNIYTMAGLACGGILTGICYCLGIISDFSLKRKEGDGGQIACSILAMIFVLFGTWIISGGTIGHHTGDLYEVHPFASGLTYNSDAELAPYIYYSIAVIFTFLSLILCCKFVCGTLEGFGQPEKRTLKLADIIAAMALVAVLCVFGCLYSVNSSALLEDEYSYGYYLELIFGCGAAELGFILGIVAWDQKRRLNKIAVAEEEIVEEAEYAETDPDIDFGL